jgi:glycosyltransferase involved in cell wall biosynthesis
MAGQSHTPLISLVVPFYNEGEVIDRFFAGVIPVLEAIDDIRFEIVCVNDGSADGTLDRLVAFSVRDPRVRVIDLTCNFGKEAALTAGLEEANGDAVIPIDANLQDWPCRIPMTISHWRSGAQGVAARRYMGFALEAIRRFSIEPLRCWTCVGLTIAALAVLYGGFIVGRTIVYGHPAPSYASVISSMLFVGGMALIGIGVVGRYIGRLEDASNEDPIYRVRRRYQARSGPTSFPAPRALR